MSYAPDSVNFDVFAADAAAGERAAFLRKTYLHLAMAIFAFVGIEAVLLNTPAIVEPMMGLMMQSWWMVLLAFMAVGWVAEKWATSGASKGLQYAGLMLYTVAEAIIFVPLLYVASHFGGPEVIPTAGLLTLIMFGGLTAVVFVTGADFSFMRTGLMLAGFGAMGVVFASMLFGFSLGIVFSGAMVILASAYVLYYTSNVLHHYRTDQYVAAALALFAAIALLFWYILQIVLSLTSRD